MELILLLILSAAPGIFLLGVILYMDRHEREPMRLVILAFFLGILSTVPALLVESILGIIPIFNIPGLMGAFLSSFFQVAWIEELSKLGVILLFLFRHKEFNEENDGIVYVGASALGFAVFENIFYVLVYGYEVGFLRAVSAVPIHCFTGVIMGYFVGLAKFSPNRESRNKNIIIGYLTAYFIHAVYNTLALSGTYLAFLIFPVVIATIISGILLLRKGRKLSIKRWQGNIHIAPTTLSKVKPGRWKLYLSRLIIAVIIIFWILLITGYNLDQSENGINLLSLLVGGAFISFFPFLIALVLEISHFFSRRRSACNF